MKRFVLALAVWCVGVACQVASHRTDEAGGGYAFQVTSADLPRICIMDSGAGSTHEASVRATLLSLLEQKNIPSETVTPRLTSLPIYEPDGRLMKRRFLEQIDKATQSCDLVHLSWNLPHTESTIEIERALDKLGREHAVLVGAGGGPPTGLRAPLSGTVLGNVSTALIVGELGVDGLTTPAYSGAELLTALHAPAGTRGSSFSSLVLTAEIAAKWNQRRREKWLAWSKALREDMSLRNRGAGAGALIFRSAAELVAR